MMGTTHLGIGLSAALAYNLTTPITTETALVICGCAVIGSILPDIDKDNAPMRRLLGLPGHLLLSWLPHRGPTHSLLAVLIVGLVATHLHPIVGMTIALTYTAHLVSDAITLSGIPLLWPYHRTIHLLPDRLRIRVNGRVEHLLQFVLDIIIIAELLFTFGVLPQ